MFARVRSLSATCADWLDSRTGYRALLESALHEPLPRGTGWLFTTGSMITLLVGVQFVTGVCVVVGALVIMGVGVGATVGVGSSVMGTGTTSPVRMPMRRCTVSPGS